MELYGYRLGDFRGKGSLRVKNGGRCWWLYWGMIWIDMKENRLGL
jgi:hypothetical protein